MAYGDGGGSNLGNKTVTFKGFSSKADTIGDGIVFASRLEDVDSFANAIDMGE